MSFKKEDTEEVQKLIDKANIFFEDVLTQIGIITLQDYANLNELGILLTKYKTK